MKHLLCCLIVAAAWVTAALPARACDRYAGVVYDSYPQYVTMSPSCQYVYPSNVSYVTYPCQSYYYSNGCYYPRYYSSWGGGYYSGYRSYYRSGGWGRCGW